MTTSAISYVHGATDTPLLGETIGQNLDRDANRRLVESFLESVSPAAVSASR